MNAVEPAGSRRHRLAALVCHAISFARYACFRAPANRTAMSATTSIETLRRALAPVEALRGEHSQLESCLGESFTAIDALHGELSDWQRDLTRQQAVLDQREAALREGVEALQSETVATLEQKLTQARSATRQLEEKNADQLHAIEDLDRQLAIVKAELRAVNKQAEDRAAMLEAQRGRADDERQLWTTELREMRRLMERVSAAPLDGDVLHSNGVGIPGSPAD
jgi:chromosome segregation ATPase